MKRRVNSTSTLARSAGLWLRCFLNGVMCIWLCMASADLLNAQIDVPGPERLSHVEGHVVSPVGQPVADLEVTLLRENKTVYQTKTNTSGDFRFDHISGQFTLKVARSQYSAAVREIVVTDEIVTTLERKRLYVILGPGACKDECSSVLTSKRDFDRAIRKKSKH